MLYFLLGYLQLARKIRHTIVCLLVGAPDDADELAVLAPEYNCGTLVLVLKQLFIRHDFLASFVLVAAAKHELAQEISRHAVHPIKLALIPAVRARIGVLHEPVRFTVTAQGFFTILAFDWVFENIIANAADELREKRLNMGCIENFVFFIDKLLVLKRFFNDALHGFLNFQ